MSIAFLYFPKNKKFEKSVDKIILKYYTIIKKRGREVNNMEKSKIIVWFFIVFNLVITHIGIKSMGYWWVIEIIILIIISFLMLDEPLE